jgi:hypothetical protein
MRSGGEKGGFSYATLELLRCLNRDSRSLALKLTAPVSCLRTDTAVFALLFTGSTAVKNYSRIVDTSDYSGKA